MAGIDGPRKNELANSANERATLVAFEGASGMADLSALQIAMPQNEGQVYA